MIDEIIDLLERLTGLYKKLYDVSLRKKELIVANDAQGVSDLLKEEWNLMSEATDLEDERSAAVSRLLPGGGEEVSSVPALAGMASPGQAERLLAAAALLKELLDKQRLINKENQSLLELHLEYMEHMVNTVLREPEVSNIYGSGGRVEERGIDNRSILDSKA
jgi:hypothetical protein